MHAHGAAPAVAPAAVGRQPRGGVAAGTEAVEPRRGDEDPSYGCFTILAIYYLGEKILEI